MELLKNSVPFLQKDDNLILPKERVKQEKVGRGHFQESCKKSPIKERDMPITFPEPRGCLSFQETDGVSFPWMDSLLPAKVHRIPSFKNFKEVYFNGV
jgi:hypothetical protein